MIKAEDVRVGRKFVLRGNLSPKGKYKDYYNKVFTVVLDTVSSNAICRVVCDEDNQLFHYLLLSSFDYIISKKSLKSEIVSLSSKLAELQTKLNIMDEYGLEDIDPQTERAIKLLRLVNKGSCPITKEQIEEAKNILS